MSRTWSYTLLHVRKRRRILSEFEQVGDESSFTWKVNCEWNERGQLIDGDAGRVLLWVKSLKSRKAKGGGYRHRPHLSSRTVTPLLWRFHTHSGLGGDPEPTDPLTTENTNRSGDRTGVRRNWRLRCRFLESRLKRGEGSRIGRKGTGWSTRGNPDRPRVKVKERPTQWDVHSVVAKTYRRWEDPGHLWGSPWNWEEDGVKRWVYWITPTPVKRTPVPVDTLPQEYLTGHP